MKKLLFPGKKALSALGLCLMMLPAFVLAAPGAMALGEQGSISVIKKWDDSLMTRPESVRLELQRNGQTVSSTILSAADATADGSWLGSFDNVPFYDENGLAVEYTVIEEALEGYTSTVEQQPQIRSLDIKRWGEKITPASSSRYSIGNSNLLAAKKGGKYYVWTREAMPQSQKLRLISLINEAGLQGFGKSLNMDNTAFASGLPAAFEDGVSLQDNKGSAYVEFDKSNVWSLFYTGSYEYSAGQGAVIRNRALSAPPSPTTSPQPLPQPSPTPAPQQPPKTGDRELALHFILLWSSLGMAALTFKSLRKN